MDLSLDYRVLAFALVLSLVTGVAFGLAPALKATKIDLVPTLRDDGETRSSDRRWLTLKNALVVFQVAVSVVLLGVTSFFLQMLSASRASAVGFAVDGVAMLETDARYAGYSATDAANVYEELRRRVAAIPGVQSAVLPAGLPMQADGTRVIVEGAGAAAAPRPAPRPEGRRAIWAGPGYFDMLRIPDPVRPGAGRAGSAGHAARGRHQRDHGAAVLRRCRLRCSVRRPPLPVRTGHRTPGSRSSAWRATPGRPT